MKYKRTDGRPWYKQVVTGLLFGIGLAFFAVMAGCAFLLFLKIGLFNILCSFGIIISLGVSAILLLLLVAWAMGGNS